MQYLNSSKFVKPDHLNLTNFEPNDWLTFIHTCSETGGLDNRKLGAVSQQPPSVIAKAQIPHTRQR